MSDISKPNSRFAILLEDEDLNNNNKNTNKTRDNGNKTRDNGNKERVTENILKNEDNIFKSDRIRRRKLEPEQEPEKPMRESEKERLEVEKLEAERLEVEKLEAERLEREKLEVERYKETKLEAELSLDNFPELMVQEPEINNDATYISFLDKLNTEKIEKEEELDIDDELDNLEPGWQIIKRDLETGKIVVKSKSSVNPHDENNSETELAYKVIREISFLHEKRTNEYIDRWGYDEWESTFRFPNYDYEYFDKLDELYQEELEAENDYECNDFNGDNIEYNGEFDITFNYE